MAIKLVVLYTRPDDPDAFDKHYLEVHAPLVKQVPGLLRFEGARFVATPDATELTYHRIAELYFEDEASLQSGMGSAEGTATAADYTQIAPPGSRMFVAALD
jgi:uncharacterized protein (TIGR02118 family)